MKDTISGKPLIELLWMATERGVIRKWSVEGPRLILHREAVRFAVPAVSAGSVLRQLLLDQEGATMWAAYRRMRPASRITARRAVSPSA